MNKVINGVLYDPYTAKDLGHYVFSNPRDFHYINENLYQTKKGHFFLHGEGGPLTRYAEILELHSYMRGEKIIPLSREEAAEWVENHLSGDEYIEIFGDPESEH